MTLKEKIEDLEKRAISVSRNIKEAIAYSGQLKETGKINYEHYKILISILDDAHLEIDMLRNRICENHDDSRIG